MEKHLEEVESAFLKASSRLSAKDEAFLNERYYKCDYKLRKITRGEAAKVFKKGFSFSTLEEKKQLKIWGLIFKKTRYLGVGSWSIDYAKGFQKKGQARVLEHWPELKTWVGTIDNWVHGDMLSGLYCDCLSEAPSRVYPELSKWVRSRSPWKKRMAILSLLYYYNPKRAVLPFEKMISFIKPNLAADHYYLQKSIGWHLRELGKVYPKKQEDFIKKHLAELRPEAFTTAVEGKAPKLRKEWAAQRRELRKQR